MRWPGCRSTSWSNAVTNACGPTGHTKSSDTSPGGEPAAMPLIALSLLLQIACCVHVIRSGRPHYWIYIVIIGSFLGVAVYCFAEVLPNLHRDPVARRVAQGVRQRVDPEHGKRRAARQLDIADTLENRRRLAEQSMASGDYQQALELYRTSLSGMY